MSRFGELIHFYRGRCTDSELNKPRLSQARLGELVGRHLGMVSGYTAAAVSDWERGESKISAEDWRLLTALLRVLHECGGLQTVVEANTMLQAGNYRPLEEDEARLISPEWVTSSADQPPRSSDEWRMIVMFLGKIIFRPTDKLRQQMARVGNEPPPNWPRFFLYALGWPLRHWSSDHVLMAVCWAGVWLATWWAMFPVLNWPFVDSQQAQEAMILHVSGSLGVPFLIGSLIRISSDAFWQSQDIAGWRVRFFTYQGAYVGFQVGYMTIFLAALFGYALGFGHAPLWITGLAALGPVVLGYAAAREVPFNIWRIYGKLSIAQGDVAILVTFVLLGPAWGGFFYWFYPEILLPGRGAWYLLAAAGILAALTAWQRRKGQASIPAYVWVAVFGLPTVLQMMAASPGLFPATLLAGILGTLCLLMAWGRMTVTLPGLIVFMLVSVGLALCLQLDLVVGRIATLLAALAWWRWGRQYLWVPVSFWLVMALGLIGTGLIRLGWLADLWVAIGFGVLTAAIWWWEKRRR